MVHLSSDSQPETILKEVFFTVTAPNLLGTFKGIMIWVLQSISFLRMILELRLHP